jgi:hypothetical protein
MALRTVIARNAELLGQVPLGGQGVVRVEDAPVDRSRSARCSCW